MFGKLGAIFARLGQPATKVRHVPPPPIVPGNPMGLLLALTYAS